MGPRSEASAAIARSGSHAGTVNDARPNAIRKVASARASAASGRRNATTNATTSMAKRRALTISANTISSGLGADTTVRAWKRCPSRTTFQVKTVPAGHVLTVSRADHARPRGWIRSPTRKPPPACRSPVTLISVA